MTSTATKPRRAKRLTREEQKAKTKERLLDAAEEVFKEAGLAAASIERISERAGFTRGAFYSNYSSKEELYVELMQRRAYDYYHELLARTPGELSQREALRWGAEEVRERYADPEGRWLFTLWLELLAVASRNPKRDSMAAGFWRGTRATVADRFRKVYEERGKKLPMKAEHLASAMTALDIGLAVQNLVDPKEVPLDVYPPLYELLFGDLVDP